MVRGTLGLMTPFLAAGVFVSLPSASADMLEAIPVLQPVSEAVAVLVARPAKSPCSSAESRFDQAVRRHAAGDWLAADEIAGLVTILAAECGWVEGIALANAQAAR